jgi:uncharacterized repeat protein (TIGR01451 family)
MRPIIGAGLKKSFVLLVTTGLVAFGTVLAPVALTPALASPGSAATEVNPNVVTPASNFKYGGRIESLSINPVNPQIVLAASEKGGLWRSTDGGSTWGHVDELPLTRMYDVDFAIADPSLVIATGDNDGASPSRGGIWRSTDGGATWSRPASNVSTLCDTPSAKFQGAHWADIAGTTPGSLSVFVATDCGVAVSTDSGANFTGKFAGGAGSNAQFWDVKARAVGASIQVDACGGGGFTRSTNGGGAFSAFVGDSTALDGSVAVAPCRIAIAPNDANTVFISSFQTTSAPPPPTCTSLLQMATDANAATPTWTDLRACADGNRNGRWPFVVTHPDSTNPSTQFQVYFGNNTRTNVQTCTYSPTTCTPGAAGPPPPGWPVYDASHPHNGSDPTDIVFDPTIPNGCPALVAGDGGVAAPSDCSTSPGSFTMQNTNLNALDAINIAGSVYATHTSLYFGTQDNGIFVSTNDGVDYNRFKYDIYGLLADHTGPGSQVLYRDAAYAPPPPTTTNHVNLANEDLSSSTFWNAAPPLPPGNNPADNYSATQFGRDRYAFITPDVAPSPGPANWRMFVTTNDGGAWTQMGGNAPGAPVGNPMASGTAANPVFYMMLSVGGANRLYRLAGPMNSSAVYTNVTSNLNNLTTFAVHPSNPLLLYANDAGANKVMKSINGGASWVADNNLTTLVQRGGQFPFANGGSQIAAFAFDGNSNTVMAGASASGVFASTNGGASWFSVRGAENLPRIAGFFFDERTDSIYFASGGRGMWRIALPQADLSIYKSSDPNPVVAGEQLTYSLTVQNDSGVAATAGSVVVSDDLPADVTFLTSSDLGCAEGPTGHLECPVPDLAPGDYYTFTITVLVHSNTVLGTGGAKTIVNTASVTTADSVDPPGNNTATATTTVIDSANLAVSKLCKPDTTIYAGTPIQCSVFVDNNGPSDARNVVLDDVVKSSGSFTIGSITVDPPGPTCSQSAITGGTKLTCNLGDLAAASTTATGRVTVNYQISNATEGQDINNIASVRSDTPDPDASNQAEVNLTVTAMSDLGLTKTGPSTVVAGTSISWTLSVHNVGPSTAKNVRIADTVPAGVSITSVSMPGASCTAGVPGDSTQPTTCTSGSLAPGANSTTMTINGTVDPQTTGVLHNDARVSSDTFDGNSANDLAHIDTNVTVQPDVSIDKVATPNPATAGTALSYQLTISNAGPSTATSVTLSDPLPPQVVFFTTGGSGTCGYQTNTHKVTCQLPNLDPGKSTVVFIYTTVKPSAPIGPISNTATVASAGTDPVPGNNSDTESTPVQTRADLGIVLTSDLNVYKPSKIIHYTWTVTNLGPSDAASVSVAMTLPPPKVAIYNSNNGGCPAPVGSPPVLTCSVGLVPAGGTVTVMVNVLIRGNKGTITSTAVVSSTTIDPVSANNTSIRVVTVK